MAATTNRILVVGGGPAGAATAFWLAKAGFEVVVAERAPESKFALGQGIDITGPGVHVIRKMDLERQIRSQTTREAGFALTNDSGELIGVVGTRSAEGKGFSPTQEIEIMRGELCTILADVLNAKSNVTYRYGCSISDIQQRGTSVMVGLSDTGETEEFTCIIGADGLRSKVRNMTFDGDVIKECYSPLDCYVAFFSMPGDPESDLPNSRAQQSIGGRTILLRPADENAQRTSCYMCIVHRDTELEHVAANGTLEEQRNLWADRFKDLQGLTHRAIAGLKAAQDLYCTRIVQVKLPSWHSGRCVLVGDAAYGPSPLTGQGTTLALVGAYVLTGELAMSPKDPQAAFARYRETLKDYVQRSQRIPFGGLAPQMGNPQTYVGIWTLRTIFWLISWTGIWKLAGGMDAWEPFVLPEYNFEIVRT